MHNTELNWEVINPDNIPEELEPGRYICYYYWEKEVHLYNDMEYTFPGHHDFDTMFVDSSGKAFLPKFPGPFLLAKVDFDVLKSFLDNALDNQNEIQ